MRRIAVCVTVCLVLPFALRAVELPLPSPAQDQGLPYTRSAHAAAMALLGDAIAVFPGSRYAWVFGNRVRLDDANLLRGDAIARDGAVFVPRAFAGVLTLTGATVGADTVPADLAALADRWVHTIARPAVEIPATVPTLEVCGEPWVDALSLSRALGRTVTVDASGIVLVADAAVPCATWTPVQRDLVVTMFDTPEKLADPDLATKYIPLLKLQGKWTDHTEVTAEQLALLDRAEPQWPETPRADYNLTGFNAALLGTAPPPPGVYPRLLFSPADLPIFRARVKASKLAQKSLAEMEILLAQSWLNPETSDGQVFARLAAGDTDSLLPVDDQGQPVPGFYGTYPGQKPGIYSSHINYNAQCLVTIAMYALLTDDEALGHRAANAIATYCRLGEPAIDAHLATSDSEWGTDFSKANNAATHWRGMHGVVPHMDLPFLLDFGGAYMDAEQKDMMRRIIAKATYGRRTGGGDGPRRCWRDINHVTWHLTHGLAVSVIEGLEGFDPEAYASHAELTRDFLEYGLDRYGFMFESNGKSGGGIQFQILSMIALARRGDNLWGHPHWRLLSAAQAYVTAPNGKTTVSSGTWGSSPFTAEGLNKIKAFYPDNVFTDYLLTNAFPDLDLETFDVTAYRAKLAGPKGTHRMRLPGISYPGFAMNLLYDTDWPVTKRADLPLELVWNNTVGGILSVNDGATETADWMCLYTRADHYMGSGHHHADIGMFYFSGLGVNWFTESPIINDYSGKYHNEVLIDGIAEPDGPASRGRYLGAEISPVAVMASADLTASYTWRWCTQVMLWKDEWMTTKGAAGHAWELEDDPEILAYYQGTQRYKMRPWWPTYTFSNWIPTVRQRYNPVEYVYRTAGLVRGAHSYGVVVDDLKKDDAEHLYQWCGILGPGVWQARSDELPPNQVWLAHDGTDKRHHANEPYLRPRKGAPVLLVCALGLEGDGKTRALGAMTLAGPGGRWHAQTFYDALLADVHAMQVRYRILLIPMAYGAPLPKVAYDAAAGTATVAWPDQTDTLHFTIGADQRTTVRIERITP